MDHFHGSASGWSPNERRDSSNGMQVIRALDKNVTGSESSLDTSVDSRDEDQHGLKAVEEGLFVNPDPERSLSSSPLGDLAFRRAAPSTIWSVVSSDDDSSCQSSDSSSSSSTRSSVSSSEAPYSRAERNGYLSPMNSQRGLAAVVSAAGAKPSPGQATNFPVVSLQTEVAQLANKSDEACAERRVNKTFTPYASTTEATTSSDEEREELDGATSSDDDDDDDDGIPVFLPDSPAGPTLYVDTQETANIAAPPPTRRVALADSTDPLDFHEQHSTPPASPRNDNNEDPQSNVSYLPRKCVTWRSPLQLHAILEEATQASDLSTAETAFSSSAAYSSSAATAKSAGTGPDEMTLSSREVDNGDNWYKARQRWLRGGSSGAHSVDGASEPSMTMKDESKCPFNNGNAKRGDTKVAPKQWSENPQASSGNAINRILLVRLGSALSTASSVTYSEGMFAKRSEKDEGAELAEPHEEEPPLDEKETPRKPVFRRRYFLLAMLALVLFIVCGALLGFVFAQPKIGNDSDDTSHSAMVTGSTPSPSTPEPIATPSVSPTDSNSVDDFPVELSVGLFFGEPVTIEELDALEDEIEDYLTDAFAKKMNGFNRLDLFLISGAWQRKFSQSTLISLVMTAYFDAGVDSGVIAAVTTDTCELLDDVDGIQIMLSRNPLLRGLTYGGAGGHDCENLSPGLSPTMLSTPSPPESGLETFNPAETEPTAGPVPAAPLAPTAGPALPAAYPTVSPQANSLAWDPTSSPSPNPPKAKAPKKVSPTLPPTSTPPRAPSLTTEPTATPSRTPTNRPSSQDKFSSVPVPTFEADDSTKQDAVDGVATPHTSPPPTKAPVISPTLVPTTPGAEPNPVPTLQPAANPKNHPTLPPTMQPILSPTKHPTLPPTLQPVANPTKNPTSPSTLHPISTPTKNPAVLPTLQPVSNPTKHPTVHPTLHPTPSPTKHPTSTPTSQPVSNPTKHPTSTPTSHPTPSPTQHPTSTPTSQPTLSPTKLPTSHPVETPEPTFNDEDDRGDGAPEQIPTTPGSPTSFPPTTVPVATPGPIHTPSATPTFSPTTQPTQIPIETPTARPTAAESFSVPIQGSKTEPPFTQPASAAPSLTTSSTQPSETPSCLLHPSSQPVDSPPSSLSPAPTSGAEESPPSLSSAPSETPTMSLSPTATPVPTSTEEPTLPPTASPTSKVTLVEDTV